LPADLPAIILNFEKGINLKKVSWVCDSLLHIIIGWRRPPQIKGHAKELARRLLKIPRYEKLIQKMLIACLTQSLHGISYKDKQSIISKSSYKLFRGAG
jgi:hypothetical protein